MKKVHLFAVTLFVIGVIAIGAGYTSSSSMHETMTPLSFNDMQNLYGGCSECVIGGSEDCSARPGYEENCLDTFQVGSCEFSKTELCVEYMRSVCGGMYCADMSVQYCSSM